MWTINLLTGDIIEKCFPPTFMRVVLSLGEIQLGKTRLGKSCLPTAIYTSLYSERLRHTGNLLRENLRINGVC